MEIEMQDHHEKTWIMLAALLLFQIIFIYAFIHYLGIYYTSNARKHLNHEISIISEIVRHSLQINDYHSIDLYLQKWGKEHPNDFSEIILKADNGFTLSHYKRDIPARAVISDSMKINYDYNKHVMLYLFKDISPLYTYRLYIIILLLIFGTVINSSLFYIAKQKIDLKKHNKQLIKRTKELEKSKLKYNILYEHTYDWEYLRKPDGSFLFCSPACERITGYSSQEFMENSELFMEIIHPEFKNLVKNHFGKKPKMNWHKPIELKIITKDGSERWILHNCIKVLDNNGNYFGQRGTNRDITQQKEIENSLKESEEKFRSISENAKDAIILINNDGKIIFWNKAATDMFGYSYEEAMGKDPHTIIAPSRYHKLYKKGFSRFRKTGIGNALNQFLELDARKKSGEEFPIELSISSLQIKGKWNASAIIRDLSQKKLLENKLLQSQKLESIGQLAGGIAHDFNNILTAIIGYCEIALKKTEPEQKFYRYFSQILESSHRAEKLVRQLLAFSRKQVIAPQIIDINNLVTKLYKMLRRIIGEDISIEMSLGNNIPRIKTDPSQMEQIFINLVVNARDAIIMNNLKNKNCEKKITITTQLQPLDMEYIKKRPYAVTGNYVAISVSDTGIGVPKENFQKIFEPFYSTKGKEQGTGLGLATVYGIVKQNNAYINVYSELGKGTTFKIYWPLCDSMPEEKLVKEEHSDTSEGGKETILFTEDDLKILEIATDTLSELGYKVYKAENGKKAIELIKNNEIEFDLLITDLVMPEINGEELANYLKKTYPDIKILYCSGYPQEHLHHNGVLNEGINFLPKPYTMKQLAAEVRSILDRKKS